jgi:hypothetical protein
VRDDVWQIVDLILVEDSRPRQECGDRLEGNRGDGFLEWFGANARRQAIHAAAALGDLRPAFELNDGAPVIQVRQRQDVAGENQVRVLDLRIDLPDFRPIPRVAQEHRCDVPERVAALHDVSLGMTRIQNR